MPSPAIFAKLGRLYLNKGNWNGTQIVPEEWVVESTTPDTANGGARYYKYQWWLEQNGNYAAQGILGQFIFVCPSKNMIIVRLGEDEGNGNWEYLFNQLAEAY
jgi:CubicO group peptidase (beta-lactamase class C family)